MRRAIKRPNSIDKKQKFVPITMNKSTVLIKAIGRQSITSLKLFNMALFYLRDMDTSPITEEQKTYMKGELLEKSKLDFSEGLNAVFSEKDFLSLIPGRNSNWKDIRDALFPSDDTGSGGFVREYNVLIPGDDGMASGSINLITGAYFDTKDRKFYVKFINKKDAPKIAKELLHMSLHTRISLSLEMGFKSQYTLKFYELLNSEITDIIKDCNFKSRDEYTIDIGVNRMKWLIGYMATKPGIPTTVETDITKRLKAAINNEDYDLLTDEYRDYMTVSCLRYNKFKEVLTKMLEEVNSSEHSEKIYELYEEIKKGHSVKYLMFRIIKRPPDVVDEPDKVDEDILLARNDTIARVRDVIIEISPLINNLFDDESCLKIAMEANNDFSVVRTGFIYLKEQAQKEKIHNAVGTVIYGMKNYQAPIEISPEMFYGGTDDGINNILGKVRDIIRSADYNIENMSPDDLDYATKKAKYLYLDMVDADKRVKSLSSITLADVTTILKANDMLQDAIINTKENAPEKEVKVTTSIDSETGQFSMHFDD